MSVVQKDLDEDTFIGCELPLTYTNNGFFNRTKTALEHVRTGEDFVLLSTLDSLL